MRKRTLVDGLRTVTLLTMLLMSMIGFPARTWSAATGQPVAYAITPNSTITAIDTGDHTVLRTILLDLPASFIAATPDGQQLYATVVGGDGISFVRVIDTRTGQVATSVPLPNLPQGMVMSPDGGRLYVLTGFADQVDSGVSVIDTASNVVIAYIVDSELGANGIAIAPDGKRLYVTTTDGLPGYGAFDVMDTASNTLIGSVTYGLPVNVYRWSAVSPDSRKVYAYDYFCCDPGGGGTLVIDAATDQVVNILDNVPTLSTPLPHTAILYGINGGLVVAFNTANDTIAAQVAVADGVSNLALTPDGQQLYASNTNAQSIAVISTASNTVTGSIAVSGAAGLVIVAAPPPPVAAAPTVSLSVAPTTVLSGQPATVSWTSTGATACVRSGAWSGASGLQGATTVSFASAGTYAVTLACEGTGGKAVATARLRVIAGTTLSFSATDIPDTGTSILSWKAFDGATVCIASGLWAGSVGIQGSMEIGPLPRGSYQFPLTCTSSAGLSTTAVAALSVFSPGLSHDVSLTANGNVYALASPGAIAAAGGLDGHGYAFAVESLPNPLTALGETFRVGDPSTLSAAANVTVPLGTLPLSSLTLLATAVNGNQPNQSFVVSYADGTSATYVQSVSDWHTPQHYPGETTAAALTYRSTPTGAQQKGSFNLYAYRLALDGTKVATSVRLPKTRNVIVLAINETRSTQTARTPLASVFNVYGRATAGKAAVNGRLDGHGYAYDASLLPAAVTVAGQSFALGLADQADGVTKVVLTLTPKPTSSLTILATAVNGSQAGQTFVVTYQDGSTTRFTQSVSDWGQPRHYAGESIARTMGLRVSPTGTRQAGAWNLYAYTLQTDSSKPVSSLTLPNNRDVVVFGVNSQTQ